MGASGNGSFQHPDGMVIPSNDALLHEMIVDAQEYHCKVMTRRARGIMRMEPPDVLAFYDRQIEDTNWRISLLTKGAKRKTRRRCCADELSGGKSG